MSKLFAPLKIRGTEIKNRIVMSPMCQYSATDGFANEWHLVHLGTRAIGGAGLIISEATAVSPEGRISPADIGLWKDDHIEVLRRITSFIHKNNSLAGVQLAHAGRKASVAEPWNGGRQLNENEGGWTTVAPSPIAFSDDYRVPSAMDLNDINKVVTDFKAAAARALDAGFDVAEIHAAHGYLIHEFMSPLSNNRNDSYGGSFVNRIRLLLQTVDAVREIWPEKNPLFVRISATDWTDGGWTPDESVNLANILREKGVDLIDCSSGGNVHNAVINARPGYQVPFSEAIRKTGIMTGAVGMINNAILAESIVRDEKADLVLLGRELLRNPYFPLSAAREPGDEIKWPLQYKRAKI